jgi:CRP-like cAMP-binding protein
VTSKTSPLSEQAGPTPPPEAGNHLLAALPSECLHVLESHMRQMTLTQGFVCCEAGDPIEQVYFPQTGMISCLIAMGEGTMAEVSSIGREGAAGLQAGLGRRYSYTRAVVQIPGKFSVIPAISLLSTAASVPALRTIIVGYIETLWAEAQQNSACNAIHDGSSRLCRWLLQCSDRIGSEQLALTQEFLAEMLGMRRTTVTLLAQALQKKGILRYSRGRIVIVDRPRLEAAACECYDATKHHHISHRTGVRV